MATSVDDSYPEGFDASCGIPAHYMRAANSILADLIGKREHDVPRLASALVDAAAKGETDFINRQGQPIELVISEADRPRIQAEPLAATQLTPQQLESGS